MQTGDKLVIYYVKGAYGVYQTGPYTQGVEFSKAELEAATAKSLVISKATGDSYAYVKAHIVLADGSRQNASGYFIKAGGVSSLGNDYATLNYQYWPRKVETP